MKITRKELLRKINWGVLSGEYPDMDRWGMTIMERTAEALGAKVLDEPELPERVGVGRGPGSTSTSLLWEREPEAQSWPVLARFTGDAPPEFPAELVLRYNAKAKVLRVAEELPTNEMSCSFAAQCLRAAYDKEKP